MTITLPPAPTFSARTIARRHKELLAELERTMMGDDEHELYEAPGPGCGIGVDLHMKMVAEGTARRNANFDDDEFDDDDVVIDDRPNYASSIPGLSSDSEDEDWEPEEEEEEEEEEEDEEEEEHGATGGDDDEEQAPEAAHECRHGWPDDVEPPDIKPETHPTGQQVDGTVFAWSRRHGMTLKRRTSSKRCAYMHI